MLHCTCHTLPYLSPALGAPSTSSPPLQSSERLRLKYTEEERNAIQGYAAQHAKQINELLQRMPRPLLLLLKTNDCLRRVLGAGMLGAGALGAA